MSASHLRPRTAPELIDAAVQLARAHYMPLLVLSVIVALPNLALALVNVRFLPRPNDPNAAAAFLMTLPLSMVGVCWLFVGFGALMASASSAYLAGRALDAGVALRQAFARAVRLIGGNLLAYLIMFGGVIAVFTVFVLLTTILARGPNPNTGVLALLGLLTFAGLVATLVWLAVALPRYANVTAVIMFEDAGAVAALRRSRELARGSARRILGLFLLVVVIFTVVQVTLFIVGQSLLSNQTLASTLGSFFIVPIYPAVGALLTLLYYDLRIRREGLDIELMARELGDLSDAPPAPGIPPGAAPPAGGPAF